MKRLCVFCGSNTGSDRAYEDAAREMGTTLARRGIALVYGGGRVGLMGALADAALAAGGSVIGVIPSALARLEIAHDGLTELHVVGTMHERKALMAERSDAFAALPGGFGTLEELFEVVTWSQLGLHAKPCGLLNINGYFDPLRALIDRAVGDAFIRPEHRDILIVREQPGELVDALISQVHRFPPAVGKWIQEK